jgi:hypothetical protein
MRRIALLGFVLLLSACGDYVSSPFDGFGGFMRDSFTLDPNRPASDSQNVRRVLGGSADAEPLLPEAGNIWPPPPRPDPSLEDIEKEIEQQPGSNQTPGPRGSSTPPALLQPGNQSAAPPLTSPPPQPATVSAPPVQPAAMPAPLPDGTAISTPKGPAIISNGGNGVQTFTLPNGTSGRAINNGNGTMTLIGADGTVQSVSVPH